MKKTATLLVLGLIVWSGISLAELESEAVYHLIMARLLADEGETSAAAENFILAIEQAPDDPYIRLEYSKFLVRQRRLRKAVQQVEVAAQLAPDDADVLRVYAETQMKLVGQDPEALNAARLALEKLRQLSPGDLESMVTLGQIYLSEQDPGRAAEVFQEVLARTSGNRMVYRLLVDALIRAGQDDRAITVLHEALEIDPLFTRARIILAEMLGQQGRHQEAVEILAAAPEVASGDLELRKRLALELHRAGDHEAALTTLDRILQEEPGYYAGLYLKTVILSIQGDNPGATELAKRLVALNPENLEVAVLLSQLLERQGRVDEADAQLARVEKRLRSAGETQQADRALGQRAAILARAELWTGVVDVLEPRLPELEEGRQLELIFLYAEAQGRLGERGKAMAMLSRFDADTEAGRTALAKQAEILYHLEDEGEAEQRIADLVATEDFADLVRAAEVYQRLELYDEAIPILEQALSKEPDSTQVLFWLGASYERTGRNRDAEVIFEDLIGRQPDFAPALNYLAYMWAEQGQNLERALDLVQQAVALEPDNGAYIDSLGWTHFQLGQYEEARSYLEQAANLVGEDAVVFEHLGDLYVALGRVEDAQELYQRALALEDDNASQVREKLDQLRDHR